MNQTATTTAVLSTAEATQTSLSETQTADPMQASTETQNANAHVMASATAHAMASEALATLQATTSKSQAFRTKESMLKPGAAAVQEIGDAQSTAAYSSALYY